MRTLGWLLLPLSGWNVAKAFVSRPFSVALRPTMTRLQLQRFGQGDALAKRTDLRIFLTQRALQSFIFLLTSTRDPHTVRWMDEVYGFGSLESYHGTGAFNLTKWSDWDSMLDDMIGREKSTVVIAAKRRGRGHGGWSKDNPYLEDRFVEFELDIDPPSLVSRILSVREQIAREWTSDLDCLVAANEQVLASYYETMAKSRVDEEECKDWDSDASCIPVEEMTAAYTDGSADTSAWGKLERAHAFDRTAMMMLSNSLAFDARGSSPYRKGNFDLLLLLATQESIHRVLKEYAQDESRRVSFEWLAEFYKARVRKYFDGAQEYGRADDFMEELLLTSPVMKTAGKKMELVDPLRIAEDILRLRSNVCRDWKEIAEGVPVEHTVLRRNLLAKQMGGQPSPFAEMEGFE